MKINLIGKTILDLDDNPVPGGEMSKVVSDLLATTREKDDPQKLTALARKIRKGECDLDNPDLDLVERVIKAADGATPFARGQLLDEIGEQRRAK